ncbi:MAG: exo-alpha-sialidase [Gammaproteobacteria bacterium]|nr:exo-alpha-sialidase [Gammaproteobacteria bacterium]
MSKRLYVGTRKGLFVIERKKKEWKLAGSALLGDPITMLLPEADDTVTAAQSHGHFGVKIKRSTDGGETFEERPVPAFPEKPEGVEDVDPIRQTPIPWDLKTVWSLETGGRDRPNELWCGTIPGGLFHSADGGDSWQLVESLWNHEGRKQWMGGGADYPGIHSIMVDPRDSNTVRIGVSCGGIWATYDHGQTWNVEGVGLRAEYAPPEFAMEPNGQDAHRAVQCRDEPDTVWIQHHNGIFMSRDSGRTCSEITDVDPSTFGFAVVVHPEDPDAAWFVPGVKDEYRYPVDGKLVVTHTRDGGKTFKKLKKGLPKEPAYDLVYRHGMDIDAKGDRIAFGSTTGNLWVSDDQGREWQCVSHTLPPIYCVRFGP